MKKWGHSLLVTALLLSPASLAGAQAAGPVHVTVDGKVISSDVTPLQTDQQIRVPLRAVVEAAGGTVTWNAAAQKITVSLNGTFTDLQIGSSNITVNGQAQTVDTPPQITGGQTVVSLRFLNQALGLQAAWDEESSTVVIENEDAKLLSPRDVARLNMDRMVILFVYDEDGEYLGSGSGFVVGADGKIITNAHVVEGATKVKIRFQDHTEYETDEALLYDKEHDLALLQIEASNLPTITFGDSDKLELGEEVVAIGSPIGFQNTVSAGLVSGLNRSAFDMLSGIIPEEELVEEELTEEELAELESMKNLKFIQTNAQISFGSSGGALFNMQGEVVGVTSSGFTFYSGDLNFAIPATDVQAFLAQKGKPTKLNDLQAEEETGDDPDMEPADEESSDIWDAVFELQDALDEAYPEYTLPGTDQQLTLYFDVWPSDDDTAHDVDVYVEINAEAMLNADGTADAAKTTALIRELISFLHEQGAVNPLINLHATLESKTFDPNLPRYAQRFDPRTGIYTVERQIAWALLDDETMTVTYQLNPHSQNAVDKTLKLH